MATEGYYLSSRNFGCEGLPELDQNFPVEGEKVFRFQCGVKCPPFRGPFKDQRLQQNTDAPCWGGAETKTVQKPNYVHTNPHFYSIYRNSQSVRALEFSSPSEKSVDITHFLCKTATPNWSLLVWEALSGPDLVKNGGFLKAPFYKLLTAWSSVCL